MSKRGDSKSKMVNLGQVAISRSLDKVAKGLQEWLGASNYDKVFSEALALLDVCKETVAKGGEILLFDKVRGLVNNVRFSGHKEVDKNRNFVVVPLNSEEFFRLQDVAKTEGLPDVSALIKRAVANMDNEAKGDRLALDLDPEVREILADISKQIGVKNIDNQFLVDAVAFFAACKAGTNSKKTN